MSSRRILFLGGSGVISTSCVRAAVAAGHDVTVLNRGRSPRALPGDVRELVVDVRDAEAVTAALAGAEFDVVADFLSFVPAHVQTALTVAGERAGQYIFISSASAYQKPPARVPVTESTPLRNPFWQYSRDKIACEDLLVAAYRDRGLPVTIVRPSHTYDATLLPTMGGWTDVARLRAGKPVVVHGDGTTQWTLTHSDDFAVAFTGLLGNRAALGEAFTITGTHAPTWNQIYTWLAEAAGVADPQLVHIASETIAAWDPDLGPGLLGDNAHSMVFDNAKVTALVPAFATTITFDEGARRILAWFDTHPEQQQVNERRDALFDRMIAHARAAGA
ncbi:NAD-dependent epimerase/dehydratase family protein [Microbacterium lushaniae]|uniref:NAD-dependent epimerase/dehydratase family protein n=1 Tax=Microbacterium lushaniae TaxID=2614639 RepID=A0A5J6L538_9MICO|nr:NAD-dependent epimerase/dehydratase family protein [Microbacterium lushaniae]QEW03668.1 NAD-dependent epimerase/dehydratase family protein [Microbacterium lushaniae]